MAVSRIMNWEDRLERGLWIALLLLVPVSSSPFLPLGNGTVIRPLAFVPAVLLLCLAAVRILFLNQRPYFSRDRGCFAILFCFVIYVVISGLVHVAFVPDDPFKGQSPLDSLLRALATLVVGSAFYALARIHILTRDEAILAEKYL